MHFLVRKIVAANEKAPLPRVPIGKFEVTTSKCVMIVGVGIFTMAQGMGVYPENYHLRDTPACRGKPRRLYNNTFICSYCL
jgi:hypothetical protein